MCDEIPRLWTLKEVSEETGFSLRALELDCRAGRIAHIHRGRERAMTAAQVQLLIETHTKKAAPTEVDTARLAAEQQLARRIARRRRA